MPPGAEPSSKQSRSLFRLFSIALLIGIMSLLALVSKAQGLEGIIVEEYHTVTAADASFYNTLGNGSYTMSAGMKCYRIYVDMAPGYKLNRVYGSPETFPGSGISPNPLDFTTTTTFFNDDAFVTTQFPGQTRRFDEGQMFDSYLTINRTGSALGAVGCGSNLEQFGVTRASGDDTNGDLTTCGVYPGFNGNDGNIPGTSSDVVGFIGLGAASFGAFTADASTYTMINNGWTTLPASSGPTADNRILIGQFTTSGTFSFHINVELQTPVGGNLEGYVWNQAGPGETVRPELTYPVPCIPAAITSATSNSPICSTGNLTLDVVATGTGPLTYLWTGAGTITNAGTASASVTGASTGNYNIAVSNGCGNVNQNVAVTVNAATTYYADLDGDGFGDANGATQQACTAPSGFVANNSDLCPADPLKQAPGACGCGVADVDTDSDGIADCVDNCPNVSGQIGSTCDDGNACTTGDVLNSSCVCAGVSPSAYFNMGVASVTTSSISNTTLADVNRGNNNGTTPLISTTSASSGYAGTSGSGNAGAACLLGAMNPAASTYFEFVATPSAGYIFTLSGINFGTRSTSTGPQAYTIRTSADGFAADVATGAIANNSTWALKTNQGLSVASLNGQPLTIRLFGHSGAGSPSANTANWRIDDVTISGCSTIAPPPVTAITGCSSSQSPYLKPLGAGNTTTSLLTVGDLIGGYDMVGIPDGMGAYDNGNGTFTLLVSHELGATLGTTRAHGFAGSFVSKWILDKSTLCVQSGSDLITTLLTWNGTAFVPATAPIGRLCSSDLPEVSAFYNAGTGKGTTERIFMNGEEVGAEGRAFAHIATGPNAGTTYQLPYLGRFSWENSLANPATGDKTVVVGTDDTTPGQVYVYIGSKQSTGNEIEKAGLQNGKLFGLKVNGLALETAANFPGVSTPFSLFDLGFVQNTTGAALQSASVANGVTEFLRPEDAHWDPSNPNTLYFVTTASFTGPSRLYKVSFTDILQPELGGTIVALLDGTEGQKMMDNMTVDQRGGIYIQEDPGNQAYIAKLWKYDIATDALTQVGYADSARFVSGAPLFLTQDEEHSGIIDMQDILGKGRYLFNVQAHYSIPGELVEGGQLLEFTTGDTAQACVPAAIASITGSTTLCSLDDLALNVAASGTLPLSYSWSGNGNFLFGSGNASALVDNASTGSYTVTVSNGCGTTSGTVNVTVTPTATYYADVDGDGFGDAAADSVACTQPTGYVANSTDLCPADPLKQAPGACGCGVADVATTYYADADGDGFGDPANSQAGFTCNVPVGFVTNNTDNCPAVVGVIGSTCDDGNVNTTGDVLDANCICAGQVIDCLGVAGGTALPGTACNDNNASTGNDVYGANCVCAGQLIDCLGVAGGSALPGTSCDDNNATTGNDVYGANCVCAGQLIDCLGVAGGSALPGTSCDDNNATTGNDVYGANCVCAGQTIDCLGVAGGSALPGTSCDDNNATTGNDVYGANCVCAGQTIDCLGVAGGSALPGTACNDNNATTGNDVYGANCVCAGQLIDCLGVAGGSALPGTACNDNNATTSNDVYGANCVCAGQTIDCLGVAGGSALPGTSCDDNNAGTINDVYGANCQCAGTPIGGGCTLNEVTLTLTTDNNGAQTSWEIVPSVGGAAVCSGDSYASNATITAACCLPNGCYNLRVFDSFGDGMASGPVGGWVLRNAANERIIDNAGDGIWSGPVAQAPDAFCLPIGTDRLTAATCDQEAVTNSFTLQVVENTTVTGQYNITNNISGYQFWIYNPDGSYSRRVFQSHLSPGSGAPAGTPAALRASYFRLNTLTTNTVPGFTLLNVRVRARVAGAYAEFGPACRMKVDPTVNCQTTQLTTTADPGISCGATVPYPGGAIHANAVPGANKYQFRFTRPGYTRNVASTSRTLTLSPWSTNPLQPGLCYDVVVRASFDNGASWCAFGASCQVCTSLPAPVADQRDVIVINDATLTIWPNPNNGEQLTLTIDDLGTEHNTVSLDIVDLFGKQVIQHTLPVNGSTLNTVIELNGELASGVYMVNITAGDHSYLQRLVIQ